MLNSSIRFFVLIVALGGSLAHAADADLPRYKLPSGRKLAYTMSSSSKSVQGPPSEVSSTGSWQFTVVRENPDGSRRVIVRSTSTYTQVIEGQKVATPERVSLAYADIFADGRMLPNKSLGMTVDISSIFPPLPSDAQRAEKGWSHDDPVKLETMTYAPKAGGGGDDWTFTADQSGLMSKVYLTTEKSTYHFDRAKGVVTSVDGETSQDFGVHSKGTETLKLESDETVPADQLAPIAADFELLFAAKETYTQKLQAIDHEPAHADALLNEAKAAVDSARAQAKTDAVKAELDKMIQEHDAYAKGALDGAEHIKQVLDKPAPDWQATDIDGKPLKLSDFRGKVVVMDFWYRGCGWCMFATPQVKQLAEDFKGQPVAVLGMNTDEDEKDARFVIDAMGMTYPTVKAAGIPDKYGVEGFPTMIVIDPQGVIREVHTGYSPTLREDIGKRIKELLAPAAAAKAP